MEWLKKEQHKDKVQLTADDIIQPIIKVIQPLSPEIDKGSESFVEGVEPGDFFNPMLKKSYGPEIRVCFLNYKRKWMEYEPGRGPLVGIHEPYAVDVDDSNFKHWRTKNGNTVVDTYNFYILIEEHFVDGPVILPMASTFIKHAKVINSTIRNKRFEDGSLAPYFAGIWRLWTGRETNTAGTWYNVGKKKTTFFEFVRFLEEEEYNNNVSSVIDTVNLIAEKQLQIDQYTEGKRSCDDDVLF